MIKQNFGILINYIKNLQKMFTSKVALLKIEEIIDTTLYKNIKPIGSRPGILYRLGKVHKEKMNGLPPFPTILSAISIST